MDTVVAIAMEACITVVTGSPWASGNAICLELLGKPLNWVNIVPIQLVENIGSYTILESSFLRGHGEGNSSNLLKKTQRPALPMIYLASFKLSEHRSFRIGL